MPVGTAVDLPVQDEAAADSGAHGDEQHLPVGRGAQAGLGEAGHVRVVVDDRGQARLALQLVADRPVAVGVVRCPQHPALRPPDDAGRADPDGRDVAARPQPRDEVQQDGRDDDRPRPGRRGSLQLGVHPAGAVDDPASDLGPADVEADGQLRVRAHACMMPIPCVCHHRRPGTARHAPSPSGAAYVGRHLHPGWHRRPEVPAGPRPGGEARPRRRHARAREGDRRCGPDDRQGGRCRARRPSADHHRLAGRRDPRQDRRRGQGRRGHDAGPGQVPPAGLDGARRVPDPDDAGRAPLLGGDRPRGQADAADPLLQERGPAGRSADRGRGHRGQAVARLARAQGRQAGRSRRGDPGRLGVGDRRRGRAARSPRSFRTSPAR